MSVKKFKRGQLKYFLGCRPYELAEYSQKVVEDTEYILLFVEKYRYDYTKSKWIKNK